MVLEVLLSTHSPGGRLPTALPPPPSPLLPPLKEKIQTKKGPAIVGGKKERGKKGKLRGKEKEREKKEEKEREDKDEDDRKEKKKGRWSFLRKEGGGGNGGGDGDDSPGQEDAAYSAHRVQKVMVFGD